MSLLRSLAIRLRALTRRHRDDRDFHEEIESHLAFHIEGNLHRGLDPAEARRQAVLQLGALQSLRETQRDHRGFPLLESLLQDFRHAFRSLRRSPGFTLVALLTLACGIGISAALFSIVDATLLAPLNTPDSATLVWIDEYSAAGDTSGGTPLRLADWQSLHSLESATGLYSEDLVLTGEGQPRRLNVLRTIGPAQQTFRARLQSGRLPTPTEAKGLEPVILITAKLWRTQFESSPIVLGRTLHLSGQSYLVIGVLTDAVQYPEAIDAWSPAPAAVQQSPRIAGFLGQVARLAPGVSMPQAQAEMDALSGRLGQIYAATDRGRRAHLVPLLDHVTSETRAPLLTLFGAVLGVLLAACLNVAGLLLARAMGRRKEAAIRIALGAGRARLVRLFLAEGFLLSLLGGIGGLAIAAFAIDLFQYLLPAGIPRVTAAVLDVRTVAFVVLAAGACGLLCGAIPAIQLTPRLQAESLQGGARTTGPRDRVRGFLVSAEIAVSMALLVTTLLLAGSYLRMHRAELGFVPSRALSFTVLFPWDTPDAKLNSFAASALQRLSAVPGVQSAGIVDRLPLHGGSQSGRVLVRGVQFAPPLAEQAIAWRTASPGYFQAAGIALERGALFNPYLSPAAPRLAVVNQRLAKMLFPGRDPIGQEIARREGSAPAHWFRIVGVIHDVRQNPADIMAEPEVYVPWGATYWPVMNFVVRSAGSSQLAQDIRNAIQPLAREQVIEQVEPMTKLTAQTESAPRGRAWLLGCFALATTLLAGIGVFGLLSQEVVRRTPELGIRIALGAEPRRLLWTTTLQGLRLAVFGLLAGCLLSALAGRLIETFVVPATPLRLSSYLIAAATVLLTALLAGLIPSLRAARISPSTALRGE